MKKYLIGIYEKAIPEKYSILEMLQFAKEAGYDFFEISIDRTEEKIARLYQKDYQDIASKAIKQTEFPIQSLCLSALGTYTLGNDNKQIEVWAKDIFEKAVIFAEMLGIRIIQIPAYDMPKLGIRTKDTDKRFLYNLQTEIRFAAAHGVLVALENMENDYANTIKKCMRIINQVNSPYLQLYPDSGNIMSAASNDNINIIEDMYAGYGHYVGFHLKETKPDKFGGLFYGDGQVDFPKMVKNAWDLGVRRFVMEYWYTGDSKWKKELTKARELCISWIEMCYQGEEKKHGKV